VAVVDLGLLLARGEHDLGRVHDDHVVATVEVGGKSRLVLPPEDGRDTRSEPAEDSAGGIDLVPGAP
jgi:hypothetical protein